MELIEFFHIIKIPATLLHVISVVFGMGAALVSDLLFSFFGKDKKLNKTELKTFSALADIVFWALWIIAFSGVMIFFSNVEKYIHSAKFLAKMTVLLILLVNGYVLNSVVWPHLLNKKFFTAKSERIIRRTAFACGAISVISWLTVCGLGVLDSLPLPYFSIITIYLGIILFGIMVALGIEKKELN